MPVKKVTKEVIKNDVLSLPSDNTEMEKFILKNKTYLTEQALSSIEFGVEHKLPFVEVFKFDKSDFVITVPKEDFLLNVDHIYNFYLESENYELCPRAVKLQAVLKNLNSNEKETQIQRDT